MTKTKTHTYRISVDSGKRTKMKTMTENFAKNFAGACVRDMRIELNLRQNVQFYRFERFRVDSRKRIKAVYSVDANRSMRFQ